jgi:hypothetical protein
MNINKKGGVNMWQINNSDLVEWLENYDGPKFHAVLSDPPYGLAFMGKKWDSFTTPQVFQT